MHYVQNCEYHTRKKFFKTSLKIAFLSFTGQYLSTLRIMMSRLKKFETREVDDH